MFPCAMRTFANRLDPTHDALSVNQAAGLSGGEVAPISDAPGRV